MVEFTFTTGGTFNATSEGDDLIISANNVTLFAGDGDDTISIVGAFSGANLNGGNGNDDISADSGNDVVNGNMGNDTIAGDDGNDTLQGGQDFDILYGLNGNDDLNGNRGGDTVDGNAGNDTVHGGRGADYVGGGTGDDVVFGDLGDDQLNGGTGADIFILTGTPQADPSITTETDRIQDFNRAEGDKIGLVDLEFGDLVITTTGQTRIDYDANGTHHVVFLLGTNTMLTESDFNFY